MSLKDDVTFGVSTKQAPHCLAWAVLAGEIWQAGRQSVGQGQSSKKLHKNLFVFERSCVLAAASLLLHTVSFSSKQSGYLLWKTGLFSLKTNCVHCTGGLLS